MVRETDQVAQDLAHKLARIRLRGKCAGGILQRQPATLGLPQPRSHTAGHAFVWRLCLVAAVLFVIRCASTAAAHSAAPAESSGARFPPPSVPGAALLSDLDRLEPRLVASAVSVRELQQFRATLDTLGRSR